MNRLFQLIGFAVVVGALEYVAFNPENAAYLLEKGYQETKKEFRKLSDAAPARKVFDRAIQ